MDKCSYFIEEKALFGSFPSQEDVEYLESIGTLYFVDLTMEDEKNTSPYTTNYNYMKYPIEDRQIPRRWHSFAKLILTLCNVIKNLQDGEKLYLHCKGGHGRSGIVVACILCCYLDIDPQEALKKTTECHAKRKVMRDEWRKMGSPQSFYQKNFVRNFFRSRFYSYNDLREFSDYSAHPVLIQGLGKFPNAHCAYQALKAPQDENYISQLKKGIETQPSYIAENWDEKKLQNIEFFLK